VGYGPPAHQKAAVSQPWAAGHEVGAVSPAKKIKLEPDEEIAARIGFLAGKTGLVITASGVTLSHSTTMAGGESQPVGSVMPVDPSLKSIAEAAAFHPQVALPADTKVWPVKMEDGAYAQDGVV
jgi:hypothetical protein